MSKSKIKPGRRFVTDDTNDPPKPPSGPSFLKAVPEPTHPSPLKLPEAPFRVRFVVVNNDPSSHIKPIQKAYAEAGRRLELHFGEFNWIEADGTLAVNPKAKGRLITLKLDFDIMENALYGIKLPPTKVLIEKLESGFSVERWKLVVTRRPQVKKLYADFIRFGGGKFHLQNLREYFQKRG
ncbi:MAG TPA: hypothetical protein VMR73_02455 [Candidatus Paceibacterota bacterium]|nr:hypothetical protein [Candidatus Paceibacterota bacterium]